MTSGPADDLPVPDGDAYADLADLLRTVPVTDRGARVLIRAIAAPVVAAVLREEADRLITPRGSGFLDAFTRSGPYSSERQALAARLRARADRLG